MFLWFGGLAGMLITPPAHAQEVLDGLAAVVNDQPITFSQVRELVAAKEKAASEQFQGKELSEKIKQIRVEAIDELVGAATIVALIALSILDLRREEPAAKSTRTRGHGRRFSKKCCACGRLPPWDAKTW
jgi:hypothetical protein